MLAFALLAAAGASAPQPLAAQAASATNPDKALVARGDSIFKGKLAGALCWTCHGPDAKGMKGLGPDLTDKTWLHGDGTVEFVQALVKTGVRKPKKGATPMPPFGGIPLNDSQIAAVATYVHSLSVGANK